jgi:hypothetical protein
VQNIDILYILQPVIVIAIASSLMLDRYRKRRFHRTVFLYSLIAYGVAIALKYGVQISTFDAATSYFGEHSVGLAFTMVFKLYSLKWA